MGFSAIQNVPRPDGIIQVISVQSTAKMSSSSIILKDNSAPQITEGVEYFNLSITPTDATSLILIKLVAPQVAGGVGIFPTLAIFRSDQNDALICTQGIAHTGLGEYVSKKLYVYTTAGTTSPLTISMRFGPSGAGTVYMNADDTNTQYFGGTWITAMTATELAP
jgi:hypothetical protein